MPKTIWLARHGNRLDFVRPEWFNTAERKYDPPLSEDGLIQAQQLGKRLKGKNISQIISSPFLRTIQTANEVAQILDLSIKLESGLGEWLNPEWLDSQPKIHPPEFLAKEYPRIDWSYKSAIFPQYPETESELIDRTVKVGKELLNNFSENILIIGHSVSVMSIVRGLVKGHPPFRVPLCSLTEIVCQQNTCKIKLQADIKHLT